MFIEEDTTIFIFQVFSNTLIYGCISLKAVTEPFYHLNEIHWTSLLKIGTGAVEHGGHHGHTRRYKQPF